VPSESGLSSTSLHLTPVSSTRGCLGKKSRLARTDRGGTKGAWLTSPYWGKTRLSSETGPGLLALGGFQSLRGASTRGIFPQNLEGRKFQAVPTQNPISLVCSDWAESFRVLQRIADGLCSTAGLCLLWAG